MSVVGLRCWPCEIVARSSCRYICGLLGMTYRCNVSKITNLFPTVAVRRYSVSDAHSWLVRPSRRFGSGALHTFL